MLYVKFDLIDSLCNTDGFVANPSATFNCDYFDYGNEEKWLQDPIIRDAIVAVDQIPLGDNTLLSLAEYGISPLQLSTGTKNLVLCRFRDYINRISAMGPNCYPFLGRIAAARDVRVGCSIPFKLPKEFFEYTPVYIENVGKLVSDYNEWRENLYFRELIQQDVAK